MNDLDDFSQDLTNSSLLILKIFSLIKIIFSDLFFDIITFIFDIFLFILIKKSMKRKNEILELVVNNPNTAEKLKENKSIKKRMIKWIKFSFISFTFNCF